MAVGLPARCNSLGTSHEYMNAPSVDSQRDTLRMNLKRQHGRIIQ